MVFVTVLKAKHRRCEQHEQRPVSRPLPWSRKKSCYQLPKKSKSWCIRTRAGRFLPCCGPEFAIWWRDYRSSSVEGFAGFERWKSLQSGLAIAWECGRTSSASVVFVWTSYSFVIEFKLHCHFFLFFVVMTIFEYSSSSSFTCYSVVTLICELCSSHWIRAGAVVLKFVD